MTSTALSRSLAVVALLLAARLAFTACGESAQDKAKAEVCSARADISKQLEHAHRAHGVRRSLPTRSRPASKSIANDLTKIKKAQANLAPARKEQVQAATHTFETQLSSILTGITSNLSLSNAETQFKSALTQLADQLQEDPRARSTAPSGGV